MQGPAPFAGTNFGFGMFRFGHRRICHYGDERIQRRINMLDSVQAFTNQFDGREIVPPDQFAGFRYGAQLHLRHLKLVCAMFRRLAYNRRFGGWAWRS